jgi:hypothetical protein
MLAIFRKRKKRELKKQDVRGKKRVEGEVESNSNL